MLKQDVLEYVHSKVRWYAIHQTKKVSFRLNPNLNRSELKPELKPEFNDV